MLKLSVVLEATLEFIEVRAAERKRRKGLRWSNLRFIRTFGATRRFIRTVPYDDASLNF